MFKNCDNHGNVFTTQSLQFHITGKASSGHPYQEAQHPLPRTYSTFDKSPSFVLHYSQMEGQHPSSPLWSLSHPHWLSEKVCRVGQTRPSLQCPASDWEISVSLLSLQHWWQRLLRTLQETIECPGRDCWCHGLHTAFGSLLMFSLYWQEAELPFLGHSHWEHPPSKARVCSRLDWQHLSNSYVSNSVFPFQTPLRNVSSYLKFSSISNMNH